MNVKENPLISIVLPTYNVERYIERCLSSCVNQTYRDIEIIVVDDCGQDSSIILAKKMAEIDGRIIIVNSPKNMGTYHARRIGTEVAKGKYIIYLDPDDELQLSAVEVIVSKGVSQLIDIVFYGTEVIPDKKRFFFIKKNQLPSPIKNTRIERSIFGNQDFKLGAPGKAYRAEIAVCAFEFMNVSDETRLIYGEDILFFFSAVINSKSFTSISDKLYKYYQNPDSITQKNSQENIDFQSRQIKEVLKIIENSRPKAYQKLDSDSVNYSYKKIMQYLSATHYAVRLKLDSESSFNLYLINLYKSFVFRKSIPGLIRLFVFCFSLGMLRI